MTPAFTKTGVLCIILNLGLIASIFIFKKNLPPTVPLFYGLPVSQSQLAPVTALVIPPTISIIFIILNIFLNNLFKNEFLTQILTMLTVVTTALSAITVIKIMLLVGSFT